MLRRLAAPIMGRSVAAPVAVAAAVWAPHRALVGKPVQGYGKAGKAAAYAKPSKHRFLDAWICGRCRAHNFPNKPLCYACGSRHPKVPQGAIHVGEWRCPRCRGRNTDLNAKNPAFCFNCKAARPGTVDHAWYCLTCHKRNEATAKQCVQCRGAKPGEGASNDYVNLP